MSKEIAIKDFFNTMKGIKFLDIECDVKDVPDIIRIFINGKYEKFIRCEWDDVP